MTAPTQRKTVPLSVDDLDRVNRIDQDPALAAIAARYLDVVTLRSEAALIRALLLAGLSAVEQEAAEQRYAELAATEDDEDRLFRLAQRSRRRDAPQ